MKYSKVHLNIGTEEKPKAACGHRGKSRMYASEEVFRYDLGYSDKCLFCMMKGEEAKLKEYWDGSITAQLKNKEVKLPATTWEDKPF